MRLGQWVWSNEVAEKIRLQDKYISDIHVQCENETSEVHQQVQLNICINISTAVIDSNPMLYVLTLTNARRS